MQDIIVGIIIIIIVIPNAH